MKTFRVIHFKRGFIDLYQSQVKTWIGWRSFSAHMDGRVYYLDNPGTERQRALGNIEYYRLGKGLNKKDIKIIE